MNEGWRRALDEFIRELEEKHDNRIDEILIFGSYARGDTREGSDIDVLIVGDVKLEELIDISFPVLLKYGLYISPIVMTRDYYEFLKSENSSLIKKALEESVRLFARV